MFIVKSSIMHACMGKGAAILYYRACGARACGAGLAVPPISALNVITASYFRSFLLSVT